MEALVYAQPYFLHYGDTKTAISGPRCYIQLSTALLAFTDFYAQLHDLPRTDTLYQELERRVKDSPQILIDWIRQQDYDKWRPYFTVPDKRVDADIWKFGWSDEENWTVREITIMDTVDYTKDVDGVLVTPVANVRSGEFRSVFSVPDDQDTHGTHKYLLAKYRAAGIREQNYIDLAEDHVTIPFFRRLPNGGVIPGVEDEQLVLIVLHRLKMREQNDFTKRKVAALQQYLKVCSEQNANQEGNNQVY
ncbi:hypothetical protein PV783_34320 [Chitinophaga sp. CC14]|uniref:hypothetical protein n=1 Tax=Chitinophaga sp. CC14 TaxID=3029199 RepID=UPI003B767E78